MIYIKKGCPFPLLPQVEKTL